MSIVPAPAGGSSQVTLDTLHVSSGDPIADRRISYAQMLAEAGDFAAAAEVAAQALERVPGFLSGLELLGRFAEKAGQLPEALAAWRQMLALDPADRYGAELKLATHGALERQALPALAYVEALFDAYASDFDSALTQHLAYRVPQVIADMLAELDGQDGAPLMFARALDLGCGTGLMGERLRRRCSHLAGVDLSDAMVEKARGKRIYDSAEQGELVHWLARRSEPFDLVTAADVFSYLGALAETFDAVARVLSPGGLFAFSVEAHDGVEPCVLLPSLRYAHSEHGLIEGLARAGFEMIRLGRTTIRMDQGAPIAGFVVLAKRRDDADAADDLAALAGMPAAVTEAG